MPASLRQNSLSLHATRGAPTLDAPTAPSEPKPLASPGRNVHIKSAPWRAHKNAIVAALRRHLNTVREPAKPRPVGKKAATDDEKSNTSEYKPMYTSNVKSGSKQYKVTYKESTMSLITRIGSFLDERMPIETKSLESHGMDHHFKVDQHPKGGSVAMVKKHVYNYIKRELPPHSAGEFGDHVRVHVPGRRYESADGVDESFGKNGAWRTKGGKFASTKTKGGAAWQNHVPAKLKERVKALGGKMKTVGTGGAFVVAFESHEKALEARTALMAEGWRVQQHDVPGALYIQGNVNEAETAMDAPAVAGSPHTKGELYKDPSPVVHVHLADGAEHKVDDDPSSNWQRFKRAAVQHGAASIHADKEKRTFSARFWPHPDRPHADLIAAHDFARHARLHLGDFASKARLSQVHGDVNEDAAATLDAPSATPHHTSTMDVPAVAALHVGYSKWSMHVSKGVHDAIGSEFGGHYQFRDKGRGADVYHFADADKATAAADFLRKRGHTVALSKPEERPAMHQDIEEKRFKPFTGVPKLSDVVHVAKKLGAEVTNKGGDVLLYHPSWGAKLRIHSQRGDATKEILHHVNRMITSANEATTAKIDAALAEAPKAVENFSEVFDDPDAAEDCAEQRSLESADSSAVFVIGLGDDSFTVLPEDDANARLQSDEATTVVAIYVDGEEISGDEDDDDGDDDGIEERHSVRSKVGNRLARSGLVTGQLARNKNKRQSARARSRRGSIYAAKKAARKALHHPDSH